MVTMEAIQEYVDAIAEKYRPERIILFGSYAYGTPREDSDVDLLVVMRHEGGALGASSEIYRALPGPPFSAHVVVRDPDVLRWRIENNDWFLREATEKGTVLYEAADIGVGQEGGGRLPFGSSCPRLVGAEP